MELLQQETDAQLEVLISLALLYQQTVSSLSKRRWSSWALLVRNQLGSIVLPSAGSGGTVCSCGFRGRRQAEAGPAGICKGP